VSCANTTPTTTSTATSPRLKRAWIDFTRRSRRTHNPGRGGSRSRCAQLAAQVVDVHFQHVGIALGLAVVEVLGQVAFGQDLPGCSMK
jgi:hypothetical protein